MATGRPRALVTGASSGIGQAFAERLARDGYDIAIVARRRERLDEIAERLRSHGGRVAVFDADLADPETVKAIAARISADGKLSLLVNNAGFAGYRPFLEVDPDVAEQQIALHTTAVLRLTHAALLSMVARGAGAVINVASMLAFSGGIQLPSPKRATYAATKAFIVTFSQILAQELAGTGVQVQVLCPGLVRTEFHDTLGGAPPGVPATEAADIVAASLAGLARGEVVCIPTLADPTAFEKVQDAQRELFAAARADTIAVRYRGDI